MDLSLKNAAKLNWLLVITFCGGIGLVAFDEGFSNQVILGVIQEEMMKTFKIEATMIVRPYLTIRAETQEEAEALYFDEKFDKKEFLETGFPISNLEIDEIYEEGHEPV